MENDIKCKQIYIIFLTKPWRVSYVIMPRIGYNTFFSTTKKKSTDRVLLGLIRLISLLNAIYSFVEFIN